MSDEDEEWGDSDWHPAWESEEGHARSLALGVVAMAPLLLAYELGLASDASLSRNLAEVALLRGLAGLGDSLALARQLLVSLGVLVALGLCFRRRLALGPSLSRLIFEGAVGAVVLGPLLALCMRLFGGIPPELFSASAAQGAHQLASAARLFGGASYEELLFRVLCFGGLFVLARRTALFFGMGERAAATGSELIAVVGSSVAFAGFHLESMARLLGAHGEAFSAPVFLWRSMAGILLALLFRWRGPGVAAWTHALFNLALFLGAGVEVLV
jgi:hypothetical protein